MPAKLACRHIADLRGPHILSRQHAGAPAIARTGDRQPLPFW